MDEFEVIRRFFDRERADADVVAGIGDDGAVLRPAPGRELVVVADTLVAGVHFHADMDPADLGYRAVAVNLSDIAAMGARPRWLTLCLTLTGTDPDWLERFSAGIFEAAGEHGVHVVGGDTTRGAITVVSVQVTGDVEPGAALLRSGARAGDTIYVTGTLGDAAAGLAAIGEGRAESFLRDRFLRPAARVGVGLRLAGLASAAIDVSDGLCADLGHVLEASGVGAEVDVDRLPLSPALRAYCDPGRQRDFALSGGDDYELCFTSSAAIGADIAGVPVTAIGTIRDGGGLSLHDASGPVESAAAGYRHFA